MWDQRGEVACYVSSAAGLQASAWADIIRGHWGIENRNHYVRDVSADEDRSRIQNNPGIPASAPPMGALALPIRLKTYE